MPPTFVGRLKSAWNAFRNQEEKRPTHDFGSVTYSRPDRPRFTRGNERSLINAAFARIAMDVATVDIRHVRLDEYNRYLEDVDSDLNNCLTLEANIDQTGRALIRDAVISLMDEGCIAIVPVDTDIDPITGAFKIETLRVGKIKAWSPDKVTINLYNDRTGHKEDIVMPKSAVAIIENPLYSVVNEPNSTVQRLMRKLSLLDVVDEQSGSNKLDIIIQLPYTIKTTARREQAEERRKDLESQLKDSKYGIGYIDGTERVTQLNRPIENNLLKQVEYLTNLAFSQLGLTQEIMSGTASSEAMTNYYSRTIEPIILAITDEMNRKFLSKTARARHQAIKFFRDPFRLVPVGEIAEIADKMIRNEVMSKNEVRNIIGLPPSDDPKSNELVNPNISHPDEQQDPQMMGEEPMMDEEAMADDMPADYEQGV